MTQKEFVSAGVVFMGVIMVTPILSVVPQFLRILETIYGIPPSAYRDHVIRELICLVITDVIWTAAGVLIIRKRSQFTKWLMTKMNGEGPG